MVTKAKDAVRPKGDIQLRAETLMDVLQAPKFKEQMALALPKHLNADRMIRIFMTVVRRNGMLLQCTKQSIAACAMTCAALGLEPEPFLGHAYLVPYRNKAGYLEAQLIPGYRGYLMLARRSGEVAAVTTQVVHAKDHFDLEYGVNARLTHRPSRDADPGPPMGAYIFLNYKDGSTSFDFMSTEQIEKVRTRSKASKEGPWVTDWEEMAKKTVIRRHMKIAPVSTDIARLSVLEERAEIGESQEGLLLGEDIVEPETTETVYEPPTTRIPERKEPPAAVIPDTKFAEAPPTAAPARPAISEATADFEKKFKAGTTLEISTAIDLFVTASANMNQASCDKVREAALKSPQEFMKVFGEWYEAQVANEKSAPDEGNAGKNVDDERTIQDDL